MHPSVLTTVPVPIIGVVVSALLTTILPDSAAIGNMYSSRKFPPKPSLPSRQHPARNSLSIDSELKELKANA